MPVTGFGDTTVPPDTNPPDAPNAGTPLALVFVIAWSAQEPHRVGEVAFIPTGASLVGRGNEPHERTRLPFGRQRPGSFTPTGPFIGNALSREHVEVDRLDFAVAIRNVGRKRIFVNGEETEAAVLTPGDVLLIQNVMVLVLVARPVELPIAESPFRDWPPFGEPDQHGMLGESPAIWALRDQLWFAARSQAHVFVHGESGTGKELAARAIHNLSARATGEFIARNAATFPPGLIDAELFGNAQHYPNHGMRERPGIVGDADGGTLFLDEIAELPHDMQTHLLRVLDRGGEYHRLGETRSRRSNFRLIAATNRAPSTLKHDLLARLGVHIELPALHERREDIPLLARNLVRAHAGRSPETMGRYVVHDASGRADINIDPTLVTDLLRHRFTTHVRELDALLLRAMGANRGTTITLPDTLTEQIFGRSAKPAPGSKEETEHLLSRLDKPPSAPAPTAKVIPETAGELIALLERYQWNQTKAAKAAGMSRDQMKRLLKKYGLREQD